MACGEQNPWIEVWRGGRGILPFPEKPKVVLPDRVLVAPPLVIGAINVLGDGARQITLEILVCPNGGENKLVRALIDTGAQINVVKRGLFPEHVMRPARKPLSLTLADGQTF